ncbi:type II toxin-antitoxin system VapC family toxin [Methylocaldum sp. BRCS4]|nr:type II toxin-antitoxin system VapC family toxin [Methylocaldum sp. BRCS4]
MLAVDTNVIVRLLVNDDPGQTARAIAVFESEPIFLPKTVVLEAECVLRYCYGLECKAIAKSIRAVAGLPNVTLENQTEVADALAWFEQGLDFADTLHLASSALAERFGTFDEKLVKRAQGLSEVEPVAI